MKRYVCFNSERIVYFCTVDDATANAHRDSGLFLETVPSGIVENDLTIEDLKAAYPALFSEE